MKGGQYSCQIVIDTTISLTKLNSSKIINYRVCTSKICSKSVIFFQLQKKIFNNKKLIQILHILATIVFSLNKSGKVTALI